jgi:hypothetical protein
LRDHKDAAVLRAIKERCQNFRFALDAQVLPPTPSRSLALPVANSLAGQEPVA